MRSIKKVKKQIVALKEELAKLEAKVKTSEALTLNSPKVKKFIKDFKILKNKTDKLSNKGSINFTYNFEVRYEENVGIYLYDSNFSTKETSSVSKFVLEQLNNNAYKVLDERVLYDPQMLEIKAKHNNLLIVKQDILDQLPIELHDKLYDLME